MKTILLVLMLIVPSIVGGANYQLTTNSMRLVENRDGLITVTERTDRFKKLYYFVASHTKAKNPLLTTELIYNCDYPEIMAAIASVESEFNSNAIGKCREVSAWQILEWELGDPTNDKDGLTAALKVFNEKKVGRTIPQAIRAYNGAGPRAEHYKKLVLRKIDKIKKIIV